MYPFKKIELDNDGSVWAMERYEIILDDFPPRLCNDVTTLIKTFPNNSNVDVVNILPFFGNDEDNYEPNRSVRIWATFKENRLSAFAYEADDITPSFQIQSLVVPVGDHMLCVGQARVNTTFPINSFAFRWKTDDCSSIESHADSTEFVSELDSILNALLFEIN